MYISLEAFFTNVLVTTGCLETTFFLDRMTHAARNFATNGEFLFLWGLHYVMMLIEGICQLDSGSVRADWGTYWPGTVYLARRNITRQVSMHVKFNILSQGSRGYLNLNGYMLLIFVRWEIHLDADSLVPKCTDLLSPIYQDDKTSFEAK